MGLEAPPDQLRLRRLRLESIVGSRICRAKRVNLSERMKLPLSTFMSRLLAYPSERELTEFYSNFVTQFTYYVLFIIYQYHPPTE